MDKEVVRQIYIYTYYFLYYLTIALISHTSKSFNSFMELLIQIIDPKLLKDGLQGDQTSPS